MKLVEGISRLGVESAFEVLVRARALEAQGKHIIHLEIGEPDFPTPPHIVEAAKKALDDGWTKYGPVQGLPELRSAIAASVSKSHGIKVGPEHVSVFPGAKPLLYFAMTALVNPGDEVIFPDPGFPIYESMIKFLGAASVPVPLVERRGFSFDLDVLRDRLSNKTKLIILNSPHNPTGGVIPPEDLASMAAMLRERDVMVISDEIYARIAYDQVPQSIAGYDGMLEKTIIADGFSKTYAMTGWRLGYGVMPTWLVEAMNLLMVNSNSCTASFVQRAGIAAIGCAPHSGWAAVVALGGERGEPRVLARLRLELVDPGAPESKQPYHSVENLGIDRCCVPQRRVLRKTRRRLRALQLRELARKYPGSRGANQAPFRQRPSLGACGKMGTNSNFASTTSLLSPMRPAKLAVLFFFPAPC